MDVLLILLGVICSYSLGLAAPPVDLSDFDGKASAAKGAKKSGSPTISEREMVYLDNQEGMESADPTLRTVRYKVLGRDRPGREGKVLVRLGENQRVKFIKESKDRRWSMVEIVGRKKRAWIPSSALVAQEN